MAGAGGTVQLSATAPIGQRPGTKIIAGNLKLVSSGGDVSLTEAGNNVGLLAADLSGASSLSFKNAGSLTLGTVAVTATGPANLPQVIGVTTAGAGESITISTTSGTLTVVKPVTASGSGDVTLKAEGLGQDLVLNAAISTQSGQIVIRIPLFLTFLALLGTGIRLFLRNLQPETRPIPTSAGKGKAAEKRRA